MLGSCSTARTMRAASGARVARATSRLHAVSVTAFQKGQRVTYGIKDAVKQDHDGIVDTYKKFSGPHLTGSDNKERQKLAWQIIRDITLHSLAEEEVVYPTIKNELGSDVRNHVLDEHTELKKLLVDLDGMHYDNDPEAYKAKLSKAIDALKDHAKEEENDIMPRLDKILGDERSRQLAERFEDAKSSLPTRPHIAAPDKPATGNVVLNRATAPIDWARDAARWGGAKPPSAVVRD